jgi:hypothetical protein
MKKNSIMTKSDSLKAIQGWDFVPNSDGKINVIPLTMPKGLTAEKFGNIVSTFATRVIIDGDVRPGTASLLVFSEPLARELIETYGSHFIKTKAFIYASAL